MNRRQFLQALALAPLLSSRRVHAQTAQPKYLIVIGATGGASIVDSFLAVRQSESTKAATLNTFPDAAVATVGAFRAVTWSANKLGAIPLKFAADQPPFVTKHAQDMLVATTVGTSVNHALAQKRSLTGNAAWKGRTLQECVAAQHGAGFLLPNVNMASMGFAESGTDDTLGTSAMAELVANPTLWPLGLDARQDQSLDPALLARAREARAQLDNESIFTRTFAKSARLQRWTAQREQAPAVEAGGLLTKLTQNDAHIQSLFPNRAVDPFEAQAVLAYLLLKNKVSVAVTLSPSFNGLTQNGQVTSPPLAFDYSHNDHRSTQAYMWSRILSVIDRLVDLLKAEAMWEHTLIYVASDFGRTRTRPSGDTVFGTGHDLNNGCLMLSPMLNGGKVLGGVDPNTTLTYGFDPETGAPAPGKAETNERDIFAGVLHALQVDTTGSGLPDARAFRRA